MTHSVVDLRGERISRLLVEVANLMKTVTRFALASVPA